jgi:hypothetical protein
MALDFTNQVGSIADVTKALAYKARLWSWETVNEMTANLADEVTRGGRELGTEGHLGG